MLIAESYGKLTFVKIARRDHFQRPIALCKCECGREGEFLLASLRQGDIAECGECKMPPLGRPRADLTGQQFGKLIVVDFAETRSNYRKYWLCLCECGRVKKVCHQNLTQGSTNSCGCAKRPRVTSFRKTSQDGNYIGVTQRKGAWMSRIQHNFETIHLGTFPTEEAAAIARNNYIRKNKLEDLYAIQKIKREG